MTEPAMTDTAPLVSVVVPFFNAERFFEEAIESVFAQSYGRWELLLVDDGSSDASTVIARRYAERHPGKVSYLEHPGHANRGAASARNLGVRHARGEYVAFLDADDVWLPPKLAQQVELMERHPEAGMVCGACLTWYSWTDRSEDAARDKMETVGAPQDTLIRPPALLTMLFPLGAGNPPGMSNLIVRREIFERVGGFEERFRDLFEDHAFLAKIYLNVPVLLTSMWWDLYRRHPNSCISMLEQNKTYCHLARRSFLFWLEDYLCQNGYRGSKAWQAVRDAVWPYRHPTLCFVKMQIIWLLRRVLPTTIFRRLRAWRRANATTEHYQWHAGP